MLKRIDEVAKRAKTDRKYFAELKALELLGRHLKLFTDKFEGKLDINFANLAKRAKES